MSPISPYKFNKIREEKKALIITVALQLFANEGFFKTTINQIAKHAGISKGLMYNYFESKEELLLEIVNKSLNDITQFVDPDKDGSLSEEEFELFIRKIFLTLREKIDFWRLLSQLLIQKDVREQFLRGTPGKLSSSQVMYTNNSNAFLMILFKLIKDYFLRKKVKKPAGYDPILDMNMFLYTVEGFARFTIYQDEIDENNYLRTINKIIELYK